MATMHPANLDRVDFTAPSEYEVYIGLSNALPEKCHVFYSVRWAQVDENGNQSGEGDFVVVDPDYGFLIIEVKGGTKIEHHERVWILWSGSTSRTLNKSPYDQAAGSMWAYIERYRKKYNEDLSGTFGYAVMFPHFDVPSDLCLDMTALNTITLKDMNHLKQKVRQIFIANRGSRNTWLSAETFRRLLNLFEGEPFVKASSSAICRMSLSELQSISRTQSACLDMLCNYPQALIIGSAGTGKTFMAIKKATECATKGLRTLYVCFNRLVNQYVSEELRDTGVICCTFHGLVLKILGVMKYNSLTSNIRLPGVLQAVTESATTQFDAIIVDEAQDFFEEWAFTIRSLLQDEKRDCLYVFYDEEQNIYQRDFGEAFMIDCPPFVLKYNLRNTKNIWEWLVSETGLGRDSISNQVNGVPPKVIAAKNPSLAINEIQRLVQNAMKDGLTADSIVILSDQKKENSTLAGIDSLGKCKLCDYTADDHHDAIVFYTVQAYKGMESDIVICLLSKSCSSEIRYVAYSRAKCLLYVIEY